MLIRGFFASSTAAAGSVMFSSATNSTEARKEPRNEPNAEVETFIALDSAPLVKCQRCRLRIEVSLSICRIRSSPMVTAACAGSFASSRLCVRELMIGSGLTAESSRCCGTARWPSSTVRAGAVAGSSRVGSSLLCSMGVLRVSASPKT